MPDLRESIQSALQDFRTKPLRQASLALLDTLGYRSDRTMELDSVQAFCKQFDPQGKLDHPSALKADWKSADILFQLTDDDLATTSTLFKETSVKSGLLRSYLFFAIELTGDHYARGKLTAIARQLNRIFPMPVMVLIKHLADKKPVLSIAVINRRQNKREFDKDVLGKVTIIRDIALADPHRGHLDIIDSFAIQNLQLSAFKLQPSFDTLHAAWEQIFNIELLNNRFYKELSNWYFWALPQVDFPTDLEPDDEKRRATGLIRLLTRLIFCWFLKEKDGLIPEKLFNAAGLAKILNGFDPESETSSTYYQAILQNLFFATLNQRMGKDGKGNPYRVFATDEGFQKNRTTYDVNNLFRYEKLFAVPQEDALALFADIPFLNGGLFECLDRTEDGTNKKRYLDGFSRRKEKRPHVPDRLFFDSGETADLSAAYGDKKRKKEQVSGLISILNRYKFTIIENTPIDQEIALDPELLGKVFENLLASYNEETKTTARKQTGSFYTPRPIVDYMVDESLKAHLERKLTTDDTENTDKNSSSKPSVSSVKSVVKNSSVVRQKLDRLFTYTEEPHPFTDPEVATLITAIDEVKILDPACGSGAFPMGVLHKLVYILGKLDPDNERWKQTQLAKLDSAPMREALEAAFEDNNDDYGRKLYLIENCLYGVDIQPIAIQITKLRFFISLVCDQKTNRNKKDNHGIRPLPNLETKFVAADTLIGIPKKVVKEGHFDLTTDAIQHLQKQLQNVRHQYFTVQLRRDKLRLQREDKDLRQKLAHELARSYAEKSDADTVEKLALWDPFDPQYSAGFFDAEWMFGQSLADGFDVVIANPPYIDIKALPPENARAFFSIFHTAKNRINLYALFIEHSFGLLKPNGVLAFINPNSLLVNESYSKVRELILDDVMALVKLPDGVFENAIVETMLLFVQRNATTRTANVAAYGNRELIDFSNIQFIPFDKREWRNDPETRFSIFASADEGKICSKLEKSTLRFDDVSEFCLGLTPYDKHKGHAPELIKSRGFHADRKLSADYVPLIDGSNITRYAVSETVSEWLKYGPWLSRPRERRFFTEPRIIVRQIASGVPPRIYAGITTKQLYHSHIGFAILVPNKPKVPLKVILALLNSKLLNFYHERRFLDREKITFQKVLIANVRTFPVTIPSDRLASKICDLVDEIIALKVNDAAADATSLEREIDQHVYTLYGLTPEEIAIVEGTAK